MTWSELLVIVHSLGTVFGVGGATYAHVFVHRAVADGTIDPSEHRALALSYRLLRIGLVLLVLSGFGLLLQARLTDHAQWLYSPRVWLKMLLIPILVVNALLLAAHKLPTWLAGAIALVSWYAAFLLGFWRTLHAPFLTLVLFYIAAVLIIAGLSVPRRIQTPTRT